MFVIEMVNVLFDLKAVIRYGLATLAERFFHERSWGCVDVRPKAKLLVPDAGTYRMLRPVLATRGVYAALLSKTVRERVSANFNDIAGGRAIKTTFDRPRRNFVKRYRIRAYFFGISIKYCLELLVISCHIEFPVSKFRVRNIAPSVRNCAFN